MQGVMDLTNQFFPTQSAPSQIAGIDRAISSQVAAVQQGVNRRQHKGARLLDDTMMRPMRAGMYFNIVQYQEDGVEVPTFYRSEEHTSELQSLMRNSYAVFCLKNKKSKDIIYVLAHRIKLIL